MSRVKVDPGSGPRHAAVSNGLDFVYVSTELANTVEIIPLDAEAGHLSESICTVSILPDNYSGPPTTASHIELSP